MSEEEKKVPASTPEKDEVIKAREELEKAKTEMDIRLKDMEKEFDQRRQELEQEYEEKKATMLRDMEAAKIMAEDELQELESEARAHKKEVLCGVTIAALVAFLTRLLCARPRR